jgi:hypothetical protein
MLFVHFKQSTAKNAQDERELRASAFSTIDKTYLTL